MTHIRSTLAALLVLGGAAAASAQQATPPAQVQGLHRAAAGRRAHGLLRKALFRGITLSDAEKANLKAVQAKYAPQLKALRQQMKPELQTARDARQRGDTAALKALWQKSGPQREQIKRVLEAERADLRAALTPANQTKFDANVAKVQKRVAQRAERAWTGKNGVQRPGVSGPGA